MSFALYKKCIDATDAKTLNKALNSSKPTKADLQEGLYYAALMGDCEGIRIFFMHGAKAVIQWLDYILKLYIMVMFPPRLH